MKFSKKKWRDGVWLETVIQTAPLKVVSSDVEILDEEEYFKNFPKYTDSKTRKRINFKDNPEEWVRFYVNMDYTYTRIEIIEF